MHKRLIAAVTAIMLAASFSPLTTFAENSESRSVPPGATIVTLPSDSSEPDSSDDSRPLTDITKALVTPIADQAYTGSALTPDVIVKIHTFRLKKDVDYTVSYSNNVNIGTATVVITGIGSYTGSITTRFNIVSPSQQAVSKFTSGSITETSYRLSWTAAPEAAGYELFKYNDKSKVWIKVANTSALYFDIKNQAPAAKTRYRIRAYRNFANKTIYSDYKELTASTRPEAVTKLKISSVTTTDYTLSWTCDSGAEEYHVYLLNPSNKSWKLYKTTSSTSIKVSGREPGQKDTFKVCAVVKTDDSVLQSEFCEKTFTTKPEQVTSFSFTNTAKGYLTFSWKPVANADKYQIWYSTEKSGTYTLGKEVDGSKTSVKTGLLPTGRTYYYKIRAVSMVDDCVQNGACSSKIRGLCFNKISLNSILKSYSNSRSVTQLNAQGFSLSNTRKNQLYSALTSLGGDAGYVLYDIESGSTIVYNANTKFETASTVKLPYVTYCLREMEDGSPTLDTMLTYLPSDYNGGSSWLKYQPFYTQYSIRRVIQLIGDYSDNCGYYMMQDKFGYNGYNDYIRSLGGSSFIYPYQRWGYVTPADSARELNDFWNYIKTGRHRAFTRSVFSTSCAANFRAQLGNRYTVYEKSGWTGTAYNETAVVRAEHPYVLICFSNRTSAQRMRNVAEISESIHNDMWNYYNSYVNM